MGKQKHKTNIFVIFSAILVYLHILLSILEQALSISGRSLFFYGKSARQTLSTEYGTNVSHEASYRQKNLLPDLINNEVSTVISAMIYAPDTIHPTA